MNSRKSASAEIKQQYKCLWGLKLFKEAVDWGA